MNSPRSLFFFFFFSHDAIWQTFKFSSSHLTPRRMFCSAGLCLSALSACAALSALPDTEEENSDDFGLSQALEASASCVGWAANLAYLFYLSGSAHPSHRGPRVLTVAFLLCLAADAVNTRSVVMDRVRAGGGAE